MAHIYGLKDADLELPGRAAALAREIAGPAAADVDGQARWPKEAVAALGAQGFLGLTLPREAGGLGQGPAAFAAVVEELAQACASTAMVYVMHVSAAQAVAAAPALGRRDALLREIAAGRHVTTLAFSERGSRSQFWLPVSRLENDGPGYRTSADKSWVTAAANADSYVSSARTPDAKSPLESAVYLVRKGANGVRVAGGFDGLGLRGNDSAPVELKALRLSKEDLISAPGGGLKVMLEVVLPWFAIGTSAMANGLCRAAVASTGGHLASAGFDTDGSKLRDLPTLRARLAEMSVRTEQSRALLGHTLAHLEAPSEVTPLYVLQSRLAAVSAALDVTDLAMKACGGAAFSKRLPLERLFRDARAGWVMAPTADHLQEFVGRALTGLPLF